MIRVDNTARDYAWGSLTAIPELQGRTPSGLPEAELWLGTHPGSPTIIVEPQKADGATTIADYLMQRNEPPLPYLLKILAAEHPLSIQAHPSREQAQEGFERENKKGIDITSAERNYKDSSHKPELIVALSDRFEALCGLRELPQTLDNLNTLSKALQKAKKSHAALDEFASHLAQATDSLAWAVEWALTSPEAEAVITEVSEAAALVRDDLLMELAADYPKDPGILVALLLNRVTLTRGQALYLPAGNLHAYVRGYGVELMAASDNVLRGGLTTKHVDVKELLRVITASVVPIPYLTPTKPKAGLELFVPDVPDFALAHITPLGAEVSLDITRHCIGICTAGSISVKGKNDLLTLHKGESVFVTRDEERLDFGGEGEFFLAY